MSASSSPPPPPPPSSTRRRARSARAERGRLIAAGIAIALVVVFAIVNLGKVKVDWIVTSSHTSLTIVIAVSFLLGAGAGALLMRRRSARR